MQREKLYNLHTTALFIAVFFAFQSVKNVKGQILNVRKRYFLVQDKFVFLKFHLVTVILCKL